MSVDVNSPTKSGFVAIIGRPNVGKSTLLNCILEQKISITSRKPQTTRHQILGIYTEGDTQIVFVDTPGIHSGQKKAINRYMNKAAISAIEGVDVVLWLVQGDRWTAQDEQILKALADVKAPVVLAVNKVDLFKDKDLLLPHLSQLAGKYSFAEIIPVSAKNGDNVPRLVESITQLLPFSLLLFPEDQVTDRSEQFLAAEIIREKLFRALGEELPYSCTVGIEAYEETDQLVIIHALIWVESPGQKGIVIGKGGARLREIGKDARMDIQQMLGKKVHLETWVKVKSGWTDDERAMKTMGYFNDPA